MNFSTYALMDEGLALTVLVVALLTFVGWVVEKAKQRRMERLLAEMESTPSAPAQRAARRLGSRRAQAE